MRYLTAIALSCALLLSAHLTSAQTGSLSFAEIMPNPDGTDTKTNEYLKIKNYSRQSQSLEGYKICNINNDCYGLKSAATAGACLKIYRTDFLFTLHNDKEQLSLTDSGGNIISQVTTGAAPSGQAWLCSESYCQWGDSREICDYSDIVDPASLPPVDDNENENDNTNDNTAVSTPTDSPETPTVNNANANSKTAKKTFQIFNKKDWSRVKKEMDQKNLLSLPADIQGNILIPLNIVKANTFYLLASNNLVAVNIYASRQAEFYPLSALYQKGTQVLISRGFLKNSLGAWQLGIGKDTGLKDRGKRALNHNGSVAIVTAKGKILRQSGQYYYVENQDNPGKITTVFIPSVVWTKYLEKENLGDFPQLKNNKIVTASDVKGRTITVSGIRETSGDTQRIIVVSENDIRLDVDKKASAENPQLKNDPKDSAKKTVEAESSPDSVSPPAKQETPAAAPGNFSLAKALSQKLSWGTLWTVTSAKIKGWAAQLF